MKRATTGVTNMTVRDMKVSRPVRVNGIIQRDTNRRPILETLLFDVDVSIDVAAIAAQIAHSAACNSTGKSTAYRGLVSAKVLK